MSKGPSPRSADPGEPATELGLLPPKDATNAGRGRRPPPPEAPDTQARFGPFTLLTRAGSGGMSEVLRAIEHLAGGQERACVVKRVAPALANDQEFVAMFQEEARISKQLHHPNIVQTFGSGEIDGVAYISFEVIEGVTLEALSQRAGGQLPCRMAVEIMQAVLEALAYAQTALGADGQPLAVVHRDISPTNILVTREATVKLVDFGLARFLGREHHTEHGQIKGRVHYLAPEQVARRPVDGRTDLFSVGIVLAEALGALKPPFSHSLVREVRDAPGELPLALHHLLRRLTATRREDRPADAKWVALELGEIARSLPERDTLARSVARLLEREAEGPERGESSTARSLPPAGGTPRLPSPDEQDHATLLLPQPQVDPPTLLGELPQGESPILAWDDSTAPSPPPEPRGRHAHSSGGYAAILRDATLPGRPPVQPRPSKKSRRGWVLGAIVAAAVLLAGLLSAFHRWR